MVLNECYWTKLVTWADVTTTTTCINSNGEKLKCMHEHKEEYPAVKECDHDG